MENDPPSCGTAQGLIKLDSLHLCLNLEDGCWAPLVVRFQFDAGSSRTGVAHC